MRAPPPPKKSGSPLLPACPPFPLQSSCTATVGSDFTTSTSQRSSLCPYGSHCLCGLDECVGTQKAAIVDWSCLQMYIAPSSICPSNSNSQRVVMMDLR